MHNQENSKIKLLITIPKSQLGEIMTKVDEERYLSINEFVNVAIQTQLALEEGDHFVDARDKDLRSQLALNHISSEANPITFQKISFPAFVKIKTALNHSGVKQVEPIKKPETNDWLWGQINRVLPIKVTLRILVNTIANQEISPSLKEFHRLLYKGALVMRRTLGKIDREHNNTGSARLTTGFPKGNDNTSQSRFVKQFGIDVKRNNNPSGGLVELGLANISNNTILPTKLGIDFYNLPNNLLDKGFIESPFTKEETRFYCHQILNFNHGENTAFRLIHDAIIAGHNTPTHLRQSLNEDLPTQWSEKQQITQVNGAVSRMADLNLLERHKSGRNVKYEITDFGKECLKQS